MTRFRAAWPPTRAVGCAVTPSTRIWRVWCSITASTYSRGPRQGDRFEEVTRQQGLCLGAQEAGPGRGVRYGSPVRLDGAPSVTNCRPAASMSTPVDQGWALRTQVMRA